MNDPTTLWAAFGSGFIAGGLSASAGIFIVSAIWTVYVITQGIDDEAPAFVGSPVPDKIEPLTDEHENAFV